MNWEDGTPKSTGNDFHYHDGRPSIFSTDPTFSKYADVGQRATDVIEKQRSEGKEVAALHGLSVKADAMVYLFKKRNKK